VNSVIALSAFLLGLIPLWIMFLKWRATGILLSGLAFAFFFVQHLAFGLGGLLVAVFDEGYKYINLHGEFFYADGLTRVVLVNLVSLYAGLAGVQAAFMFGRNLVSRSTRKAANQNENIIVRIIKIYQTDLRRICFIFLVIHALIMMCQAYAMYASMDEIFNYGVQVFAKFVPGVFLVLGILLPYDRRVRRVTLIYILFYAVLQLSTGGRAPVLYAVIMLSIGVIYAAPGWFLEKRKIIVVIGAMLILPWVAIQSENIRLITGSRIPTSLEDLSQRMEILLLANQVPRADSWGYDYMPSLSNSLFRFGARTAEVTLFDVLNRTPEEIPHIGWTLKDSVSLFSSLIPLSLVSGSNEEGHRMVMLLRNYGWAVDPARGTSFPLTMLGDSWLRAGWLGVVTLYFIWGGLLTILSPLLRLFLGRRRDLLGIVIAGPIFYVTTFSYTNDIVGVLGALPRLLITAGAFSTLLYVIGVMRIRSYRR
jgi:hypothetical protein